MVGLDYQADVFLLPVVKGDEGLGWGGMLGIGCYILHDMIMVFLGHWLEILSTRISSARCTFMTGMDALICFALLDFPPSPICLLWTASIYWYLQSLSSDSL